MLLCGAKKEYNVSEWKEQSESYARWQRYHVLEKYYWTTCVRNNSYIRIRWKSVLGMLFVLLLLLYLWISFKSIQEVLVANPRFLLRWIEFCFLNLW